MFNFEPKFHNFQKKKLMLFIYNACYNIVTIVIDIFQFHVSIISNLVFP
jgi:hypothetical protein